MKTKLMMVGNFLSATRHNFSVCEELALHLTSAGWPVTTTSDKPGRVWRLIDMIQTVWRQRRGYSVAQVDVYSGPSFLWAEAVAWTLRRANKPYVLTLHGGSLPTFARRWPRRVRRLLGSAKAVTVPSRFLYEQMQAYRNDLRLIPNALSITAYPFRLRRNPKPALVWLRAFEETYNPTLAPKILALLARDFPEIQMTMIGPDKGDGALQRTRQTALELGVLDRLTLRGPVPKVEVPRHLELGDVFLNTTNVDNTPVSVIEAMACGLCVVSTNVGGLPYLLEDGKTGLLSSPCNAGAMADSVRRILTEDGLAEKLSRNGRVQAERFCWSTILPQWESLLCAAAQS